ncbi:hypothetical protein SUGI_0460330 [Cryptomeria japonica]|nr:hypothetical protein SUGI_0460330 [Cryptomeria japonica]
MISRLLIVVMMSVQTDECSDKRWNMCGGAEDGGICLNLRGSYNCSCAYRYMGDGFQNGTRCVSKVQIASYFLQS